MGKILDLIESKLENKEKQNDKNALMTFLEMEVKSFTGKTTISGQGNDTHYHTYFMTQFEHGNTTETIPVNDVMLQDHQHVITNKTFGETLNHSHSFNNVDKNSEAL